MEDKTCKYYGIKTKSYGFQYEVHCMLYNVDMLPYDSDIEILRWRPDCLWLYEADSGLGLLWLGVLVGIIKLCTFVFCLSGLYGLCRTGCTKAPTLGFCLSCLGLTGVKEGRSAMVPTLTLGFSILTSDIYDTGGAYAQKPMGCHEQWGKQIKI